MRRPTGWAVTLSIAVGLALLVLLTAVLVVPEWLHPSLSRADLEGVPSAEKRIELQQAQAKLQSEVRATLLQAAAGLLLIAGAVATWQQLQISRETQITERFSRAVDQLGSNNEDEQVGGIYTLERIAKDSRRDRNIVQAIIAAHVRRHAPWLVGSPQGPQQHPTPTVDKRLPWMEHRHPDIQAAMWVLGRRPRSRPEWQLYLSRVDLRGVFLAGKLSNAMLRHANLARGHMPNVELDDADLEDADLREANLQGARLTGANLRKADLQGADLRGADLRGIRHEGANFTGARANPQTSWPDDLGPDRRREAGIVEETGGSQPSA